jgi:hypothetical protein
LHSLWRTLSRIGAAVAVVSSTLFVACGGGAKNSGFGSGDDDGGTTDGSVANADGNFGGDGPIFTGGDGSTGMTRGCSADLQNVIDASGNVVMACPPTEGCSMGQCIAACDAAAASHGSVGCDFYAATPSFQQQLLAPCFAVFLANNWPSPVHITATRGGTTLDATQFARIPVAGQPASSWPTVTSAGIPMGEVAVLFMSSNPNAVNGSQSLTCPVAPAINASTAVATTGLGQAFHISTDIPVSAYDIHPYGGAKSFLPSAELLLPTSAWGTNYIASLPKFGDYENGGVADGPQWGQIVASVANTHVTVLPTTALPAGTGVTAAPANTPTVFTLNDPGDYIQWQNPWSESSGNPMEMSGSVIQSDQPIAFVGGNGYLCLKSLTNTDEYGSDTYGGCDSGHQMIPPVSALASLYAVAPYTTRRADLQPESVPYRIVGAVAGTTLTYDPAVSGAPTSLTVGQVVNFETAGPFVVKSQDAMHPFYIAQMMPGGEVTSGSRSGVAPGSETNDLGDEEYVNVLAPAQFLQKYVFFTDPTYATTNLVIVRSKGSNGFEDVSVDCLGTVGGWVSIGASGDYEMTNVDLLRATTPVMSCTNLGHTATSSGPFGLTVWGLDNFASYAYPAGGNVASINTVVVPPTPQ